MINADMRLYDYFTLGEMDAYGQPAVSEEAQGKIKMAINIASQSSADNVLFQNCSYVGLTLDKSINDTYVINYNEEKLKVLYVNPKGKYTQVYLVRQ